jgi:hypothetical protein
MTNNFREGGLRSHKPLIGLPEAHATPMHQENSPIQLENFATIIFSKIQYLLDLTTPEPTGITNQSLARPPGSFEVINYNEPNSTISAKLLIQKFEIKFYYLKTNQILQEKEAERVRKQILFK